MKKFFTAIILSSFSMCHSHGDTLAHLTGESVPEYLSENLAVEITGNIGINPDPENSSTVTGYWTSASVTTQVSSNEIIYSAFTFTAEGLGQSEIMILSDLSFDYTRLILNGSNPVLNLYLDTGDGYGDSLLTVNDEPTTSNQTDAFALPTELILRNGESVTIGFSFADRHGLPRRTHIIDNFILNGTTEAVSDDLGLILLRLTGESTPNFTTEYIDTSIIGNIGTNPEAESIGTGYWTDSSATSSSPPSSDDIYNAFTFTATGLTATESIDLTAVCFDFIRNGLNGSNPKMEIYLDTGSGYGAPIYSLTESSTLGTQTDVITFNTFITLLNGESATIGFSFSDTHGLPFRTHLIDNLKLYGTYDLDSGASGLDLNVNGVSDVWEYRYNASELVFNEITKNQDYDKDGVSNFDESLAGTDPFDPLSAIELEIINDEVHGLMLCMPTQSGKRYSIFGSNDLSAVNWPPEGAPVEGDGSTMDLPITSNLESYFYQIGVDDFDIDNDLVTRWEENQLTGFSDDDNTLSDYNRLKDIIQSAYQSQIQVTTDTTVAYELENTPTTITFTRVSSRSDEFLNLDRSETFQITDTTKVASNAASPSDYIITTDINGANPTDGYFTIPAGQTTATFYLHAITDNVIEPDEQLTLSVEDTEFDLWISDAGSIPSTDYIAISQAGHFLSQASMGGTPETISALANEIKDNGYIAAFEAWIDNQLALPRESTVTQDCYDFQTIFLDGNNVPSVNIQNFELVWWGKMIQTEEQLRHRVAYSLSQIFVTSSSFWANEERNDLWESYSSYYDSLTDLAFSDHRSLLQSISYDPFMGVYLSSAQNRKEDVGAGTFPDENYAREVMQLFSCGVYSQDQNGDYLLDINNDRIENYDNDDIKELAQVFTGLGLTTAPGVADNFDSPRTTQGDRYQNPMVMVGTYHDTSSKILLDGTILPADQTGDEDISDSLDRLAVHPSTAPHISRLLIKRLTNSNPSSAYIGRVTEAWRGLGTYGDGEIGDFVSVIKAILLDPEARQAITYTIEANGNITTAPTVATDGRIKEPIIKWMQFYRFAQALSGEDDGLIRVDPKTKKSANDQTPDFGQIPMRAPSVFNYYASEYSPAVGALADAEVTYSMDLTSPESEILTPYVIHQFETFYQIVDQDEPVSSFEYDGGDDIFSIDYNYLSYLYGKNQDVGDFIDDVNLWLCNGQISPVLKGELVIIANANGGASRENFSKILAIIFNSSDFSVAH